MLVLAAARGHLHLALRAIGDGSETATPALPAPSCILPRASPAVTPHSSPPRRNEPPVRIAPLPVSLLPLPAAPSASVKITVIKGTFSQTVSVAP